MVIHLDLRKVQVASFRVSNLGDLGGRSLENLK